MLDHVIHMTHPSLQILHDMEDDEMSAYFRGVTTPKILVISISRPSRVSQILRAVQCAWEGLYL